MLVLRHNYLSYFPRRHFFLKSTLERLEDDYPFDAETACEDVMDHAILLNFEEMEAEIAYDGWMADRVAAGAFEPLDPEYPEWDD